MEFDIRTLHKCSIFKNMSDNDIKTIIDNSDFKVINYDKGEIVFIEDSICEGVGIILSGKIELQKLYESGSSLTVQRCKEGDTFGEGIVFSCRNTYPLTIVSVSKSSILFISKNKVIDLCSTNKLFLNNFMTLLSDRIVMLNNKVKNVSIKGIRNKITNFLLEESIKRKSNNIKLELSKRELAEMLGIPRPSLSRELIKMKNDNLVDLNGKEIIILNKEKLENIMCK